MTEQPAPHKPTPESYEISIEDFANAIFWKHFKKEYIRDKKEIRRLEKPQPCQCKSCARRDETRYLDLLHKWCSVPPDESKYRYPIIEKKPKEL